MTMQQSTYSFHTASRHILGDLCTPVSVYLKVRDAYPQSALMESSDYHGGENSKSFIALHPIASVSIEHGIGKIRFPDSKYIEHKIDEQYNTAHLINDFLSAFHIEGPDSHCVKSRNIYHVHTLPYVLRSWSTRACCYR